MHRRAAAEAAGGEGGSRAWHMTRARSARLRAARRQRPAPATARRAARPAPAASAAGAQRADAPFFVPARPAPARCATGAAPRRAAGDGPPPPAPCRLVMQHQTWAARMPVGLVPDDSPEGLALIAIIDLFSLGRIDPLGRTGRADRALHPRHPMKPFARRRGTRGGGIRQAVVGDAVRGTPCANCRSTASAGDHRPATTGS